MGGYQYFKKLESEGGIISGSTELDLLIIRMFRTYIKTVQHEQYRLRHCATPAGMGTSPKLILLQGWVSLLGPFMFKCTIPFSFLLDTFVLYYMFSNTGC